MSDLARKLEVNRAQLYYFKDKGLSLDHADRFAGKLGLLPCELWPEWYEMVESPRRVAQKRWARAQYRSNPEYRQSRLEDSRRYRAECREYVVAYHRRYRAQKGDELNRRARERYATDPDYAERRRAAARASYARKKGAA